MKAYGGVDVKNHVFLTSALVSVQLLAPVTLPPVSIGWVGFKTGMDDVEKKRF
jgi:hypothetical protein